MVNYNGNSANVASQLTAKQVTISEPVDGDSFTAANDNSRTRTAADWLQLVGAPFMDVYSWVKAQTFSALATFSAGITSTAGANTFGASTTIANPTPTTISSFLNSYSAGSTSPRYHKDAEGYVRLDGLVTRATAAFTPAFNLPAGNRPPSARLVPVTDTTGTVYATVQIATNGDVSVQVPNNGDVIDISAVCFATF